MNSFGDLDVHLKIPDIWQQEALQCLREGLDVVVNAPTGAGKTYLVELIADASKHGQIVLAVPTRALANDKLREFRAKGWKVGIVTGDVTVEPEAPILVATLETQKPRFLRGQGPKLLVVDEYQMIGDKTRGVNYELSIAMAPRETQLLLLSGSVSNPQDIVDWLKRLGRNPALVSMNKRPVPLEEVHLDALSVNPPRTVTGFWPRMVSKALMADLGPVLIFAPQRKNAESMARQLAAAMPKDNPLSLSSAQKKLAGPVLGKLLSKRVAFHHSGLSYQQRAGIVEPLAKAGQLRIVVSTTGLAAGVNFSMRSVLVTDSQFTVGHTQQLIRPDELLQMFGRAGRRGMDTVGYALVAPDRPRLSEARARPIKRPKMLDWPSLVAVLAIASERGDEPFQAVVDLCGRLYKNENVRIGVEQCVSDGQRGCGFMVDSERAKFAQPESIEILNSTGTWEPRRPPVEVPLSQAKIVREGKVNSAIDDVEFMREFVVGRLTRLKFEDGESIFGGKMLIGFRAKKQVAEVQLAGWLKKTFVNKGITPNRRYPLQEVEKLDLGGILNSGRLYSLRWEGSRLVGFFDLSTKLVAADIDINGVAIVDTITRKAYPIECQNCPQHVTCETELSDSASVALNWRRLKLVSSRGVPSQRGMVFSYFQGGEGLAIAAALEDSSYSVDAIAHDIANLRAGYRFSEYSQYSHRLSRACRIAYSDRSYEGYLRHGLPLQYGEGAAEVIGEWTASSGKGRKMLGDELRFGDVQRAKLEWLSLLRHIDRAPDFEWERWMELKKSVRALLETDDQRLLLEDLPPLEPSQTSRINHQLRFPRSS